MKRAFVIVLDSFGVGAAPDAEQFGDFGTHTFRHIAEHAAQGKADAPGVRQGPLKLPNLTRLGLNAMAIERDGISIPGLDANVTPEGAYGYASEKSQDKDTPSGHWEIAGTPTLKPWGHFPNTVPSMPAKLINDFIEQAKVPGILGNKHASGTEIINELGEESKKTGKPIVYTSSDSVFQIAAHKEYIPLERLYEMCEIARKLVDEYNISRVIARPFIGGEGIFERSNERRDYSNPPPHQTVLDKLVKSGGSVIGVGKIPDIFANRGITKHVSAYGNMNIFDATLLQSVNAKDRTLIFSNLVDFDMLYGHRRDIPGYAHALELLDARIPELERILKPGDIVIITADHGCDPTFKGTNHTREDIPILLFGPNIKPHSLGHRETFADIGQSLAAYFELEPFKFGTSFL